MLTNKALRPLGKQVFFATVVLLLVVVLVILAAWRNLAASHRIPTDPQITAEEALKIVSRLAERDIPHCAVETESQEFGQPQLGHWYDFMGQDVLYYSIAVTSKYRGISELSESVLYVNAHTGNLYFKGLYQPQPTDYINHLLLSFYLARLTD